MCAEKMDKLQSKSIRDRLSLWEGSLAPLSDSEKQGFMELGTIAAQRPLPPELPSGEVPNKRYVDDTEPSEIEEKIQEIKTTQDLLSWFDEMDNEISADKDKVYRDYCSHLHHYCSQCEEMVQQLKISLDALSDMTEKHHFVSQKTQALHDACEQLVQEQNHLAQVAEGISSRLAYFTELEQLGQKLNAPSFSISSDTFPVLLARLDECISFIDTHPHYKESLIYLARYRQQLSRALASIKQQVTQTLKSTTQNVLKQQQPNSQYRGVSEANYSQYYGKFRACAPKIKPLMNEVESRAEKISEYSTILHDCLQCYVSQRKLLLSPSLVVSLEELTTHHKSEYCTLVRAVCNLVSRVCLDEYQLYHHFFSNSSNELNDLIETLSYQMYDALRPVVIHINHLETLTDLCTVLKVEMIEEVIEPKGEQLSRFGLIIKALLSDIQQRLVFRTQRFIQTDIRGYKPAPGDLAYPDKLIVAAEAQATSHGSEVFSDSDSVFDASGTESEATTPDTSSTFSIGRRHRGRGLNELHAMWYPTVRRTLMCLSKLYRCLDRAVFEGLAQEALSECVKSLLAASNAIHAKKGDIDSELFLIKHLLILREQIAAFNVNFSVKEVYLDFTKTKAAAFNLLKKRSRMFSLSSNNAFLEFLFEGFPELIETQLNSKKEVDMKLKQACEMFISHASAQLIHPLKMLLGKFDVIIELAGKEGRDIANLIQHQPFANAKDVHTTVTQTNRLLKTHIPLIRQSLTLYLSNEETEHILFRPIKANVLNTYQALESISLKYYSDEDRQIIACLSQHEVTLLLSAPSAPLVKIVPSSPKVVPPSPKAVPSSPTGVPSMLLNST